MNKYFVKYLKKDNSTGETEVTARSFHKAIEAFEDLGMDSETGFLFRNYEILEIKKL